MRRLVLLDSHALLHRFFHALPPLTSPTGEPTQAIFGLCRMLLNVVNGGSATHIAGAFDRPEPTFRAQAYADYKGQRPKTDDALITQLKRAREVFGWFSISVFDKAGFEADDVIGTLATRFAGESDLTIAMVSGDLDLLQLVRDRQVVVELIKNGVTNTVAYDEAAVVSRYGLRPDQLPDYKSLVGDTSDNFPGIAGIGPKKAGELLAEFGTIEGIFENIALVPTATADMLAKGQKELALWRTLARIKTDVPIALPTLDALAVKPLDANVLVPRFRELGFSSLAQALE